MKLRTELPFLESLLLFSQSKICVEVGVAKGQAAVFLCKALKALGGKYWGFDAWKQYGLAKEFKPLGSREVVANKLNSIPFSDYQLFILDTMENKDRFAELCPNNIDFAFIDGDHSYRGIASDFSVIYPKLSEMGMIVFHDTCTIDGCREFMIDLRTIFYDGSFDLLEIPLGNGGTRNPGISILMKRYHAIEKYCIDEINGSVSTPQKIEEKERDWYFGEIRCREGAMRALKKRVIVKDLSKLGRYPNRKKFEVVCNEKD